MADKIIIFRESVLTSWLRDGFTLGMLAVLPWFNHAYAGGSAWIYAAIAVAWFFSIFSRASGARAKAEMSPDQIRAWLDEKHPAIRDQAGDR